MPLDVALVGTDEILTLRDIYRQEMACQIIHDSWPGRGWTDSYLLRVDEAKAGYGSVGGVGGKVRDTVTEFFLLPSYRDAAVPLFRLLLEASSARLVEAQTNDHLLASMLYETCETPEFGAILFDDAHLTHLQAPKALFRQASDAEKTAVFPHRSEPVGDWLVEAEGKVVATGGLLFHYNHPFADIYMEVAEGHRRRGYGSFLVQELKRVCYERGRVPAARCNPKNASSRATLEKAGMRPCGRLVTGSIL